MKFSVVLLLLLATVGMSSLCLAQTNIYAPVSTDGTPISGGNVTTPPVNIKSPPAKSSTVVAGVAGALALAGAVAIAL